MRKPKESAEAKMVWSAIAFIKRLFIKDKAGLAEADKEDIRRRWTEVLAFSKAGPENFQMAVINADKLLDYCLKIKGARGETLGERLKGGQALFRSTANYQAAWNGHKLRNTLVHDHGVEVLFHEAQQAIGEFEKAFKGLGVI